VRRAPVIDRADGLVGIVTLDDLLPAIAQQLKELAATAAPEPRRHRRGTATVTQPYVERSIL